jgi:hypothetical protein
MTQTRSGSLEHRATQAYQTKLTRPVWPIDFLEKTLSSYAVEFSRSSSVGYSQSYFGVTQHPRLPSDKVQLRVANGANHLRQHLSFKIAPKHGGFGIPSEQVLGPSVAWFF